MPKTRLTDSKRPRRGETAIGAIPIPASGQVDYFDLDRPGLALRASYGGSKAFVHFYRIDGRLRRRNLGKWPQTALKDARSTYRDDRELLDQGIDPEGERRKKVAAAAAERAAQRTFADAVDEYWRRYQVGEAANTGADAVKTLLMAAAPTWHDRSVSSISAQEIASLVESIRDAGKPYLANRTFAHMQHFFGWCARPGVGLIPASPAVGLHRPFDGEEARSRVFTEAELSALWLCARSLGPYEGAYLRMMLLTGKRKTALARMRRDEIGGNGWWTPPQATARRKPKKTNWPIPLPEPALKILQALPQLDENPFVFAGRKQNLHLDPGSPLQRRIRAASGVQDFYWHAIRHTVITYMSELRIPAHVADRYTDHATPRGAGKAYDHNDMTDAVHDAADAWGRYLALIVRPRIWAKVKSHLDATAFAAGPDQHDAQRQHKREFCASVQSERRSWNRYIINLVRNPAKAE